MFRDPIKSRFAVLLFICFSFASALILRSAYIQIIGNDRLEHMARRQFQSKVLLTPRRGSITDRNGEPLAVNMESDSLAANPEKIQGKRIVARLIAKALDIPQSKVFAKLHESREFTWIKRHLTDEETARLKKWRLMTDGDLIPGLWLVKESQRVYPHAELAAHVLGTVNIDSEGSEGIELWQNEKLRGKLASMNSIKDAMGRPTFIDAAAAKSVKEGESVQTTLDASLQFAVEQELAAAVHKTNAKGGSVIVMNAVNGEILALANEPSFNPNEKNVSPDRRRNRALTDGYEPGSTLKAVLLAGAYSHGMKPSDQVWAGQGQFVVQGHKIHESEAKEKFEWLTFRKMLQVSSNVGAAKIALKLGAEKYFNTLKSFGFSSKTGTGFPGEISGRMPPLKSWQPLSTANIGFGQGILVTPMQMTRAYATFLNGGWLVQPTLIKDDTRTDPPKRVLTQAVADEVVDSLQSVTEDGGTGLKARLPGYQVAGKTGTAQELDPRTGTYSHAHFVASFIGFARNVDPKIVIFASIDEPHGVYYAAETAAPLFREVLNVVANRFSLPTRDSESPQSPALAQKLQAQSQSSLHLTQALPIPPQGFAAPVSNLKWQGVSAQGRQTWEMPSLAGLTPREAIRALEGHRFQVQVHGTGIVVAQTPEVGSSVAEDETIQIHLAEP
jgi:cell division protein FtsI (penicillin-binding protein 3)